MDVVCARREPVWQGYHTGSPPGRGAPAPSGGAGMERIPYRLGRGVERVRRFGQCALLKKTCGERCGLHDDTKDFSTEHLCPATMLQARNNTERPRKLAKSSKRAKGSA